jgi:CRP-like cAMP-binding protein
MQLDRSLVRTLPLFEIFNDAELDQLVPYLRLIQADKARTILPQGTLAKGIYTVLKGRLKIHSTDLNSKETGFVYLETGTFFGELSVIDAIPSMVNVDTTEGSALILIPMAMAKKLLHEHSGFNQLILKKLANSLKNTNLRVIMLSAKSNQRILYFLRTSGIASPQGIVNGRMFTHEEISSMTNLSRETVSRNLSELQTNGKITIYQKDKQRWYSVDCPTD